MTQVCVYKNSQSASCNLGRLVKYARWLACKSGLSRPHWRGTANHATCSFHWSTNHVCWRWSLTSTPQMFCRSRWSAASYPSALPSATYPLAEVLFALPCLVGRLKGSGAGKKKKRNVTFHNGSNSPVPFKQKGKNKLMQNILVLFDAGIANNMRC